MNRFCLTISLAILLATNISQVLAAPTLSVNLGNDKKLEDRVGAQGKFPARLPCHRTGARQR